MLKNTLLKKAISYFTLATLVCNVFISNNNAAQNNILCHNATPNVTAPKTNLSTATATVILGAATGLLALSCYNLYKEIQTEKFEEEYPKTKYYIETYGKKIAYVTGIGALIYAPLLLAKWSLVDKAYAQSVSNLIVNGVGSIIGIFLMKSAFTQQDLPGEHHSAITFKDYVGIPDEKILALIEYIKNPVMRRDFKENKLRLPKGILLYGPPGTGKTHLARAISGETNIPFFVINFADIKRPFVGQTEQFIKDIFQAAKVAAVFNKASIIFIDEIDAITSKRSDATSNYEQSLRSALLTALDGINRNNNVIILGCTNRLEDIDPAIRREGRFDYEIKLDLPTTEQRKKFIESFLKDIAYEHKQDDPKKSDFIDEMARETQGMAVATLKEIINEATRTAIYTKHKACTSQVVVTDQLIREMIRRKIEERNPNTNLSYYI